MVIHIQVPFSYAAERDYILPLLFCEFLGLEISIEQTNRRDTLITSADTAGKLIIADGLFACSEKEWLTSSSLPLTPLYSWDTRELGGDIPLVSLQVPIIYGNQVTDGRWFQRDKQTIHLGLDIFGSAFFMLTRYEEVVKPERDIHDRFPATSSLAWKEGFLDRPIVNEYLEILWACLKRLWPNLKRKKQEFEVIVGYDVDFPYLHAFTAPFEMLKSCAGDILLRRNPKRAIWRSSNWIKVKRGNLGADSYNTFDLLMDSVEQHHLKSTFYFIAVPQSKVDCNYSIHHPLIRKLVRRIYERGHNVGLHTSYHSYLDAVRTRNEFDLLKKVCMEENVKQEKWGARQHFLRWQTPITFKNLDDAGLDYDTTLSFADRAGFRCGICYEYPVFNVVTKDALRLRERPLIAMEGTVTNDEYMGLGKGEAALEKLKHYKNICRRFNGKFTLLWHNHRLVDPADVKLYKHVLEE
ncbi:MAG: polysaccharide deacetylase family protein [Thermodesulfobacteriota bacterium]